MKVLRRQEKEKKDKYNKLCLERRRHFIPLVFSVDGLHGTEVTAETKQHAFLLAKKWKRVYFELVQYIRSRQQQQQQQQSTALKSQQEVTVL